MAVEIVGRGEELEALDRFLGLQPAGGPAVLVLEGEAGIGKSSLWLAGVETARERGFRVLSARPAEVELGVAHAGLGDLLEESLDEVLPELAPPRRRALEIALLLTDDVDEPLDFRALAVAVRTALHLLAERGPVLVAIDDVQWLDTSSTAALAFALRRVPDADLRLLVARRVAEGITVSELELVAGDERTERLQVGGLSPGALHAILQQRLGTAFSRPALLRLHELSAGNPFHVLELARAGDGAELPLALEELVQARLGQLPEKTRAALVVAAAAGQPTRALLAAAGVDEHALEAALAAGVIAATGDAVRFTHPLLASVLYERTPTAERRRAHKVLAAVADDAVARARHLGLAAEGEDADTAAALDEAAATALARGAPILAAELAEHAVRVSPADADDDRRRRSLAAARAHRAAGDAEQARDLAGQLLRTTPAGPRRAEALALLATLEPAQRAVALLEEAVVEAAAQPVLQAGQHGQLAAIGRLTRGMTWAERHARAALRIADELDDDAARADALSILAVLRFNAGDPEAPRLAEQAHDLAVRSGNRWQLRVARANLGHVLAWSVDTERARAVLEAVYAADRHTYERESALALWHLSLVELRAGRWELAGDYAERSFDLAAQYGTLEPQSYFPLAWIAALRGDLGQAAELQVRGLELTENEAALIASLLGLRGAIEFWRGDAASAIASFEEAEEAVDAAEIAEPNMHGFDADRVEALLELGRIDDAVSVLDGWEEAARRVDRTWVLAQVTRCRGLVAAARGDVAKAVTFLEEAVTAHEQAGDPFGRARALLALGAVRRRARQKRPAREAIEEALAGFEDLGAASWAEKARAELGRVGGRSREEGLTAAERRVAALVAEGRTNREVASALFLAERTVSSHLSHVYAKLGVRSRTELARKLTSF